MFSSQNKSFCNSDSRTQDLSCNKSFYSCSYCGRIHESGIRCPTKPVLQRSYKRCSTKPMLKRSHKHSSEHSFKLSGDSLRQDKQKLNNFDGKNNTQKFETSEVQKSNKDNIQDSQRLKISKVQKFRSTESWNKKREAIKKRDKFMCQLCLRGFYGTKYKFNGGNLHVHHAIPLAENLDLKLSSNNLLTVCHLHHQMCDSGRITFEEVRGVIEEQERNQ